MRLIFDVVGEPAPQGSKRHVGGGRMVESSTDVRPWRELVQNAALDAVAEYPEWLAVPDKPVQLAVVFHLRRPASISEAKRPFPSVKPDLDKLVRSTMDALTTSGAVADDSRIVVIAAGKRYAQAGEPLGAQIILATMEEAL